jgi:hypothetical protein
MDGEIGKAHDPGAHARQAEQEYLLDQMQQRHGGWCQSDTFNIIELLHTAREFRFKTQPFRNDSPRHCWLNID